MTPPTTQGNAPRTGLRGMAVRWLDGHTREIIRGAATAFPVRIVGAGLGFALNVVLARMLGADGAGVYFLALTVAAVASAIATAGLGNVLVRHTAVNAERGDTASLKAIARIGTRLSLAFAVALTVLLVLAAPLICEPILGKPELTRPLQWMALTIVPQTQMRLHAQLLRGLKKIALSQSLRNVDVPLLTLGLLAILGGAYGATGAIWAFVTANAVTAVAASLLWRRAAGPAAPGESPLGARELLRSGMPILQTNLLNMTLGPLTTMLLGALGSSASVALFAVAFRTALLTRFAVMAINAIAAPKFAALHGRADGAALARTSRRSSLLVTLASLPMLACFLLFPGWTMGLFGAGFADSAELLVILALGQATAVLSGPVGHLLMMSGNARHWRNASLMSGLLCVALNLALIPAYGPAGAAIAVAAGIVFRSLLGTIQVYRKLGILPFFMAAPAAAEDES